MKRLKPLHPKFFRKELDSKSLGFKTTKEVSVSKKFFGQDRALAAIQFGITIKNKGYNLYAMGPTGIGKHSFIHQILKKAAKQKSTPSDWCYIHNFENPEKPIALELPAGQGCHLQHSMKKMIERLSNNIIAAFESDIYRLGIQRIEKYFNKKKIAKDKNSQNLSFNLRKKCHKKEMLLKTKLVSMVTKPLIKKLKKKYTEFPEVIQYLNKVQHDIISHFDDFIHHDNENSMFSFSFENQALNRYKINLLVDNRESKGAPIIFDEMPTYSNLISRIEYTTQQGALTTNFNLIRAGSLHRANGGYLMIEVRKIIKNTQAWEALKNAIYAKKIKIDPIQNSSSAVKTISLEPMPIPFDTKIILMGSRNRYYYLCQHDRDFLNLFKVAVDFDEQINRNKKNIRHYAQLLVNIVHQENLLNFDATAIAEIINYSSRLAEDSDKLSMQLGGIKDLILEASYWAHQDNKKIVTTKHVIKSIKNQIRRIDRTRDIYYEDIHREFIIIHTKGKALGQVNCLSVRRVGNFAYGHPTRVTARVRPGKGKLIDVQREIKLAGPFHSKAGIIIKNFLASRFNAEHLFSIAASLSFEQIYCWTDGDSASVGELCALLSALADVPILQSLAVTGSIDQYGQVQAVGGVNEKIEGFYDICKAKKLNGQQGVLIPAVNVKNLMLREDVVVAAKSNKFFIYPISTLDEAVTLLTGLPTGTVDKNGHYEKDSLYYKIEMRLREFSEKRYLQDKNSL